MFNSVLPCSRQGYKNVHGAFGDLYFLGTPGNAKCPELYSHIDKLSVRGKLREVLGLRGKFLVYAAKSKDFIAVVLVHL
jgi:hypothetical protein